MCDYLPVIELNLLSGGSVKCVEVNLMYIGREIGKGEFKVRNDWETYGQ